MSPPPRLCRLCVNVCKGSKSLYDENGFGTDIYDVTYKYFHPLILNMEECRHLTTLCLQCWRHICDFQDFQLSVQAAQAKLVDEVHGYVIKTEVEDPDPQHIAVKVEPDYDNLPNHYHEGESIDTTVVKQEAGLDLMDIHDHQPGSSDEDWEPEDDDTSKDDTVKSADTGSEDEEEAFSNLEVTDKTLKMFRDKWEYSSDTLDERLAKWLPNINCIVCSESYSKYSLLREHFLQHHPKEDFYILCCNRKLCAPFQIDEHLRLHNDPDAFKCDHCDKSYTLKSSLNRHIANRHPKTLKPKTCICQECGKGFGSRRGLSRHYFARHPDSEKRRRESPTKMEVPETEDIPSTSTKSGGKRGGVVHTDGSNLLYPCNECGKIFQKYESLRRHRWYNHKIRTKAASIVMVRENLEMSTKAPTLAVPATPSLVKNLQHETKNDVFTEEADVSKKPPVKTEPNISFEDKLDHSLDDIVAKWMPSIQCVACSESYTSLFLLWSHFAQTHPSEKFYISCCSRKLTNMSQIKEHLIHHDDPGAFKCNTCDIFYATKSSLKAHMTRRHPSDQETMYPCAECPKNFTSKQGLSHHCTVSHGTAAVRYHSIQLANQQGVGVKSECDTNMSQSEGSGASSDEADDQQPPQADDSASGDHPDDDHGTKETFDDKWLKRKEHLDELLAKWIPSIQCVLCPEAYANLQLLQDHFQQSHPDNRFYIMCCNRKLPGHYSMEDHLLFHDNPDALKCQVCGKSFTMRNSLKRHMSKKHPAEQKRDQCHKCGKCFKAKWALSLHKKVCRGERPANANVPAEVAKSTANIKCAVCQEAFANHSLMRFHFLEKHPGEEFHFLCCARRMTALWQMEEHLQLHNDPEAYKCFQCDRAYATRKTLRIHTNRHHPDVKYSCSQCSKIFPNRNVLKRHYAGKHSTHGRCATTKHYDQRTRLTKKELIMQPCVFCPRKFIAIGRCIQTEHKGSTLQD